MRVQTLIYLALGIGFFSAVDSGSVQAAEMSLISEPRQTLKGWGITATFVDPNGDLFKIPPGEERTLYGDLGATVFRFLVTPEIYADGVDDGTLVPSAILTQIVNNAAKINAYGKGEYVLAFVSPPRIMKQFISDRGEIDLAPNCLRMDREADYAKSIVGVLDYLRANHKPLPIALSFQVEPDWATPDQGCPMPPEQWRRVLRGVRERLDADDFKSVGIIGPDASSPDAALPYLVGPDSNSPRNAIWPMALSGLALHDANTTPLAATALEQLVAVQAHRPDAHDLWISDGYFKGTISETEPVLFQTVQQLGRDVVTLGANYWFWHQGAAPYRALETSNWQDRVSYRFFQQLWHAVRPGAVVRQLRCDDIDIPTSGDAPCAFGFSTADRIVLVVYNRTAAEKTFRFSGLNAVNYGAVVKNLGDYTEKSFGRPRDGFVSLEMSGQTLAILISDRQ